MASKAGRRTSPATIQHLQEVREIYRMELARSMKKAKEEEASATGPASDKENTEQGAQANQADLSDKGEPDYIYDLYRRILQKEREKEERRLKKVTAQARAAQRGRSARVSKAQGIRDLPASPKEQRRFDTRGRLVRDTEIYGEELDWLPADDVNQDAGKDKIVTGGGKARNNKTKKKKNTVKTKSANGNVRKAKNFEAERHKGKEKAHASQDQRDERDDSALEGGDLPSWYPQGFSQSSDSENSDNQPYTDLAAISKERNRRGGLAWTLPNTTRTEPKRKRELDRRMEARQRRLHEKWSRRAQGQQTERSQEPRNDKRGSHWANHTAAFLLKPSNQHGRADRKNSQKDGKDASSRSKSQSQEGKRVELSAKRRIKTVAPCQKHLWKASLAGGARKGGSSAKDLSTKARKTTFGVGFVGVSLPEIGEAERREKQRAVRDALRAAREDERLKQKRALLQRRREARARESRIDREIWLNERKKQELSRSPLCGREKRLQSSSTIPKTRESRRRRERPWLPPGKAKVLGERLKEVDEQQETSRNFYFPYKSPYENVPSFRLANVDLPPDLRKQRVKAWEDDAEGSRGVPGGEKHTEKRLGSSAKSNFVSELRGKGTKAGGRGRGRKGGGRDDLEELQNELDRRRRRALKELQTSLLEEEDEDLTVQRAAEQREAHDAFSPPSSPSSSSPSSSSPSSSSPSSSPSPVSSPPSRPTTSTHKLRFDSAARGRTQSSHRAATRGRTDKLGSQKQQTTKDSNEEFKEEEKVGGLGDEDHLNLSMSDLLKYETYLSNYESKLKELEKASRKMKQNGDGEFGDEPLLESRETLSSMSGHRTRSVDEDGASSQMHGADKEEQDPFSWIHTREKQGEERSRFAKETFEEEKGEEGGEEDKVRKKNGRKDDAFATKFARAHTESNTSAERSALSHNDVNYYDELLSKNEKWLNRISSHTQNIREIVSSKDELFGSKLDLSSGGGGGRGGLVEGDRASQRTHKEPAESARAQFQPANNSILKGTLWKGRRVEGDEEELDEEEEKEGKGVHGGTINRHEAATEHSRKPVSPHIDTSSPTSSFALSSSPSSSISSYHFSEDSEGLSDASERQNVQSLQTQSRNIERMMAHRNTEGKSKPSRAVLAAETNKEKEEVKELDEDWQFFNQIDKRNQLLDSETREIVQQVLQEKRREERRSKRWLKHVKTEGELREGSFLSRGGQIHAKRGAQGSESSKLRLNNNEERSVGLGSRRRSRERAEREYTELQEISDEEFGGDSDGMNAKNSEENEEISGPLFDTQLADEILADRREVLLTRLEAMAVAPPQNQTVPSGAHDSKADTVYQDLTVEDAEFKVLDELIMIEGSHSRKEYECKRVLKIFNETRLRHLYLLPSVRHSFSESEPLHSSTSGPPVSSKGATKDGPRIVFFGAASDKLSKIAREGFTYSDFPYFGNDISVADDEYAAYQLQNLPADEESAEPKVYRWRVLLALADLGRVYHTQLNSHADREKALQDRAFLRKLAATGYDTVAISFSRSNDKDELPRGRDGKAREAAAEIGELKHIGDEAREVSKDSTTGQDQKAKGASVFSRDGVDLDDHYRDRNLGHPTLFCPLSRRLDLAAPCYLIEYLAKDSLSMEIGEGESDDSVQSQSRHRATGYSMNS